MFTLIAGILSYSISVIINVFLQRSLPEILINSLIVLVAVSIGCWLILTLMQYFSEKINNNKDGFNNQDRNDINNNYNNANNDINDNQVKKDQESANNQEEEFSPMDPTVLEVEEEQK